MNQNDTAVEVIPNAKVNSNADESVKYASTSSPFADKCLLMTQKYKHSSIYSSMYGMLSGLLVICLYLIKLECILSTGLSVGLTVYVHSNKKDDVNFDGGAMSWTLLTFAVVTPIASSVRMAFSRREDAMKYLKTIKATVVQMYLANASWDWPKRQMPGSGRLASSEVDWLEFGDDALHELLIFADEVRLYLLLPTTTRARHKVTPSGRREARAIRHLSSSIHSSLVCRICSLSSKCEFLKLHGLPGNEASRMRQWEQFLMDAIEGLAMIKCYRTPQALRSYSRLLSVIVPPFFAPYHADLAKSTGSLTLACFYAALTALALTGLFECVAQLEDPFFGHLNLDGINIDQELGSSLRKYLLLLRGQIFPDAPTFSNRKENLFYHIIGAITE